MKEEQKMGNGNEKFITIIFIVNGTPTEVKSNGNSPLKAAVEKALQQTGNTGRPIEDWRVTWNDQLLDINKKIKEFDFPEGVELFVSLNAGKGGSNYFTN